ncbi:restriction endonuclease subunit S [Oceanospirillum linum]|uniref:Restriction endonuclease subunit S n=1 Tax=Oceanospirillum linum TaxID=966 RepID=A0A1T1HGE9_OCELI|nr:restriction endonuclease subunit S [Oceanospirillum linum]OOV88797.1 restriction endonuclease subunit S [Oceanospirillum linum]SEF99606.1 Type I restriction modification DNA specificity domain-containing protein [Oleiphilus messinensis]SMP22450.1 Type I restriction modification DNA specificity domain-containing protein [Oceanospirillum linum]
MSFTTHQKSLAEIASIRTGYTFRGKVTELTEGGNAHIAQIKDARSSWEATNRSTLGADQLPRIQWDGKDKAFVGAGSVILPARGSKGGYFRASCITQNNDALPLVVSSQFLIITPNDAVLPEFLCWSLNQPALQYWLAEGAGSQGSSIVMLTAKMAKELTLDIPSLETQQKILHINQLWEQEQELTKALLKNRETQMQGMFQQLLKESK